MRRILKQAEAFPHRTESGVPVGAKIYRGVIIEPTPEMSDQIASWMRKPTTAEEELAGHHFNVGHAVLDHMHQNFGGVGSYWTTDPWVAETQFDSSLDEGQRHARPGSAPFLAVMTAEHPGPAGLAEKQEGVPGEDEITVAPGIPLNITSLRVPGPQGLTEVLHDPNRPWGNKGAPQVRTASLLPHERMRETYQNYPPGTIKHDLMVPTEVLEHYREHDRPYDAGLEDVIREQGIREPVHISTNGTHAILNEGNHRLDIAKKLGIPEIPARVFLDKEVVRGDDQYGKPPVPLEGFLGDFVQRNRNKLKGFWD